MDHSETIKLFQSKAEHVSAKVQTFATVQEAIAFAIDVCKHKEACTLLPSGCEADLSEDAEALCDAKFGKHIITAPDLVEKEHQWLSEDCRDEGIKIVTKDLRQHLGGIDMAITWAQYGIAETGTLVINSTNEDLRLATMISEIHVALVYENSIYQSADDLTFELKEMMQGIDNYTAFITGASRTADIERVLALGVHGPLELYILLIKETNDSKK